MRTQPAALVPLCFLYLLAAESAIAQQGKVVAVRVVGSQRYAEAQVAAASGLQVGQSVGREEIQAAADRLAQLGPFLRSNYRFASKGEEITVEFQVEDAPTVPLWFDNFPWFTDDELTEALRKEVQLFDGTAPEQGEILEAMRAAIQRLLAGRGIQGTVERVLLASPVGEGMIQQFKLTRTTLKVNGVQFGDALAAESKAIRQRLSDLVGQSYSRFAIEVFCNEQVRPIYAQQGYLRAKFGPPTARFAGPPDKPLADNVLVVVPIAPGTMYRWGGAQWSGNAAYGPSALDQILGMRIGEAADGMKLTGAWGAIEREYGRVGYLDAKIKPEAIFDEAKAQVSYGVTIEEGLQYHMGELVITGLSLAAERKLTEVWKLPKGQVFDSGYFQEFFEKVIPQTFENTPVRIEQKGFWLRKNEQTKTVDVLMDFK